MECVFLDCVLDKHDYAYYRGGGIDQFRRNCVNAWGSYTHLCTPFSTAK